MLEILPIQSKTEQEAVCARLGVVYDVDCLAYGAYDMGEICGVCQFRLSDKGGIVGTITGTDCEKKFENLFLLGRSTLAFLDECGQKSAVYTGDVTDKTLIGAIGFKPDAQGVYKVNLEHFFDSPCKHKSDG